MLTILIRIIANNAFRNYSSIEKLLKIELSKNKIYYFQQNESMLSKLFFYVIFIDKIKKADIFSRRLRELRMRVGYLQFSIVYNFRTENLYLVNRILTIFFLDSISRADISNRQALFDDSKNKTQ